MCTMAEQGKSTQTRDDGNNSRDFVTFYIDGYHRRNKSLVTSILVTREVMAF